MGSVSHHKISTRLIIFLMLAAGTGLEPGPVGAITVATTTSDDPMQESTQQTSTTLMAEATVTQMPSLLDRELEEMDQGVAESVTSEKADLAEAETKDPKKLEIIKQIRKFNSDGSYTVGYEAEDGTFKIESRDVLGNIKGTYGYIDENGEIQRVSYNAHNSTGLKGTAAPVTEEVVHIPAKFNRSYIGMPTTRRPPSYHGSTVMPQKTSVIQTIPRKRSNGLTTEKTTSKMTETTAFSEQTTASSHSATVQTPKPLLIIRPTPIPLMPKTLEQLVRPEKAESEHITKIYAKSAPQRKETERKNVRGNFLRRQLPQDQDDDIEAQQQVVYGQSAGEEIANIFAATPPELRPIYTTTPTPRIPAVVLAARQRAAHIQNMLTSERPTTTTERSYAKQARTKPEPAPVVYEPATEPSSETSYVTDSPGSVVQIPANSNREIAEAAEDERRVYRPRPVEFRPRENYRFVPAADRQERYRVPLGIPPQARAFPVHENPYLRESSTRGLPIVPENYPQDDDVNSIAYRQQRRPQGPPPSAAYTETQREAPAANTIPNGHSYPQQSFPQSYGFNPYRNQYQSQASSPYYDFPDRPLTTRDFERILQLLIFRHQQLQQQQALRFGGYSNPYYGGPSLAPPFVPNPYQGGFAAQIPRPPFYNAFQQGAGYYDPRYQNPLYSPSTGNRQYSERNSQQQSPAEYQQNAAQQEAPPQAAYELSRLAPRRRQYVQRPEPEYLAGAGAEQPTQADLLPGNVREDLLYRMLMLAIQSEAAFGASPAISALSPGGGYPGGIPGGLPSQQRGFPPGAGPNLISAGSVHRAVHQQSPPTTTPGYSKKPVRSVQILGEE
ncbi:uncharacterized protein LOC129739450 [Uranotaenia lowii]|uniref:uncharacterized protein LOC129739450 n=1 Tax=Uranotaenia lowii TaxID=190385 RepID=UPI002478770B|nr:uncharacterized protein LOC129739450 [Uranotaenia lowii]